MAHGTIFTSDVVKGVVDCSVFLLSRVVNKLESEEEEAEVGIVVFLRQFTLHTLCGGMEEEGDEMFVGAIASYLAEGIDVGSTVLDIDDE